MRENRSHVMLLANVTSPVEPTHSGQSDQFVIYHFPLGPKPILNGSPGSNLRWESLTWTAERIVYGIEAVSTMGGKYREMWYFAWEDGQIVFKPNYMPKKYAIAIVPISGVLVCIAAIASVLEDSLRLKEGTFKHIKDMDAQADHEEL